MINTFCKSHDINDFYRLKDTSRIFFSKVSNIILEQIKRNSKITINKRKWIRGNIKTKTKGYHYYTYVKKDGVIEESDNKVSMINKGYGDDIYLFDMTLDENGLGNLGELHIYSSLKIRQKKNEGVFIGLAQIIHNATSNTNYIKSDAVFGIVGIQVLSHPSATLKKVILLEDSHTKDHTYHSNAVSSAKFITEQIRTATCFVDLFLEVPYINSEENIDNMVDFSGGIGWTGKSLKGCFATTDSRRTELKEEGQYSECNYLNLRTHYIDQRRNTKYIKSGPYSLYTKVYEAVRNKMEKKVRFGNNRSDIIERLKTEEGEIFNDVKSVVMNITEDKKMQKQIDMIKDINIKNVVLDYIKKWGDVELVKLESIQFNNPFDSKKVFNKEFLIKILEDKGTEEEIYLAWSTLVKYNTVIMDMYTIARLFRTYRDVPGENSNPATHAIFLAGNAHTKRYKNVLLELGYTIDFQNYSPLSYERKNFVEFSNKPLFVIPSPKT